MLNYTILMDFTKWALSPAITTSGTDRGLRRADLWPALDAFSSFLGLDPSRYCSACHGLPDLDRAALRTAALVPPLALVAAAFEVQAIAAITVSVAVLAALGAVVTAVAAGAIARSKQG